MLRKKKAALAVAGAVAMATMLAQAPAEAAAPAPHKWGATAYNNWKVNTYQYKLPRAADDIAFNLVLPHQGAFDVRWVKCGDPSTAGPVVRVRGDNQPAVVIGDAIPELGYVLPACVQIAYRRAATGAAIGFSGVTYYGYAIS